MKEEKIVAKRLKELRSNMHMTQEEVAKKIHISQSTYAYYETGKNEPSIKILKELAEIYKTSIDYIVGRY